MDCNYIIELGHDFIKFRFGPRGTCELLNIQVTNRRHGIGTMLLRRMIETIGPNHLIYLFTRTENSDAHGFYEANGFSAQAEIKGFYNVTPRNEIGLGDILFSGNAVLYAKRI